MLRYHSSLIITATVALYLSIAAAAHAAVPAPRSGSNGAVATDHALSSQAGIEVMRRGGNAVDAACAAAFTQGVVNPSGSGIGGGGFMLIKTSNTPAPVALDFRETAPAAASREMFKAAGIAATASRIGGLAVGVPGEVAGCAEAIRRYGKLSLAQVLAPAIRLARRGFRTGPALAKYLMSLEKSLLAMPGVARIFYPGGKPARVGQRIRRPQLARTLAAIAKHGPSVFYRGWIARDLVATTKDGGGILSKDDLVQYKAKWRKPLQIELNGHQIYLMPPPSSGGVAIIEVLRTLRHFKLREMGHNSSAYLHHLTEALKHAFADRARFLADADFAAVPVKYLTSQSYANRLAHRIGSHTLPIKRYGSHSLPQRAPANDDGTTHISAIDASGTAASLTTSINTPFGAHLRGRKTGILLNNTMDDFSTKPGEANYFGLRQSDANAIAPGKRPVSSMVPVLVLQHGKPVLAVGGSGGPRIITGTLQALLNVLLFRLNVAQAVSRSRIHHQWMPNTLWLEDDLPADVRVNLRRRGHDARTAKLRFMPAVQAVHVVDKTIKAASDPRKFGKAAVY